MRRCLKFIAGVVWLCGATAVAEPANMEELQKTVQDLNAALKAQQARIEQLETKLNEGARAEMAKVAREIAADAAKRSAAPKWLDNLKFYGDLRLRYRGDCYSGESSGVPRTKDRNRGQLRLRFGFTKTWLDDQMEVGFRLASGTTNDPTGSNQDLTDNFSKKPLWIDRAYARYRPRCLPGLTMIGGKMATPLVHSDLVWDSDLNLEGVWAQYKHKLGDFEPFVNAGYFIVNENYASPTGDTADSHTLRDVTLVAYQAGFDWKIAKAVLWTLAATYYDFDHYDVGYARAGGNDEWDMGAYDRLAVNFRTVNITNKVAWNAFGLPMGAYADWVRNCDDQDNAHGYRDQDCGFAAGLTVGQNRKKGDWSAGYKWAYIEANCTPGAFNDSNFGHSNRKGHVWRATYNLADWLTLGASLFWVEAITGPHAGETDVQTLVDLIWSF
jgi:hypothetical protein